MPKEHFMLSLGAKPRRRSKREIKYPNRLFQWDNSGYIFVMSYLLFSEIWVLTR